MGEEEKHQNLTVFGSGQQVNREIVVDFLTWLGAFLYTDQ